jgi:hypothetical protein
MAGVEVDGIPGIPLQEVILYVTGAHIACDERRLAMRRLSRIAIGILVLFVTFLVCHDYGYAAVAYEYYPQIIHISKSRYLIQETGEIYRYSFVVQGQIQLYFPNTFPSYVKIEVPLGSQHGSFQIPLENPNNDLILPFFATFDYETREELDSNFADGTYNVIFPYALDPNSTFLTVYINCGDPSTPWEYPPFAWVAQPHDPGEVLEPVGGIFENQTYTWTPTFPVFGDQWSQFNLFKAVTGPDGAVTDMVFIPVEPISFEIDENGNHINVHQVIYGNQLELAAHYAFMVGHLESEMTLSDPATLTWWGGSAASWTIFTFCTFGAPGIQWDWEDGVLTVLIDIHPGSNPSPIKVGSKGAVPIAIFGSADFDATLIDPETVRLFEMGGKVKGNGSLIYSFKDVNGDGYTDMVIQLDATAFELGEGDATLTGNLLDGTPFMGQNPPDDPVKIIE